MIYLVGSPEDARRWCIRQGIDPGSREHQIIQRLEHAHGCRPRPADRIVLLHQGNASAFTYLRHAQELAIGRREQSLRQAP